MYVTKRKKYKYMKYYYFFSTYKKNVMDIALLLFLL